MVKQDCPICCESFTPLQFIGCNYCEFKACKTCTQRYTLDGSSDPHCMSCKKTWSREYLDTVFTKKFINNDLKKHRELVLLDREKAMLPATQPACEREKLVRTMQQEIKEMNRRKNILTQEFHALNLAIRNQENEIYRVRNGIIDQNENRERRQFVRKCPKESCKGFLSTQWKCGICDSNVCKDCNEILTVPKEEHVCDENSKATVAMLAKDTKPCPSCGTMIFRISGCSQMWCPDCHTTFCWNTGRIETGMVHNPHYYEWLRNHGGTAQHGGGRVHGDFECGGLPVIHAINGLGVHMKKYENLITIYRQLVHIQRIEINRYHVGDAAQNNEDLRISYMLNEIDEKHFAFTLQKREKEREKKREYYQIYQMVFNTGAEYMRQIHQLLHPCFENDPTRRVQGYYRAQPMKMVTHPNFHELDTLVETIEQIRVYANNHFEKVGARYKCKYPTIPLNWMEIY